MWMTNLGPDRRVAINQLALYKQAPAQSRMRYS